MNLLNILAKALINFIALASTITNRAANTLKKSRQHLEKKLGLGIDESLYSFISKMDEQKYEETG